MCAVSRCLVLASGSLRRLDLLRQVGIEPDRIIPPEIDEVVHRNETPRHLVERLSSTKAEVVRHRLSVESGDTGFCVLAADTVVAVGRQILGKPSSAEHAHACLCRLSGRTHRVFTAVCVLTSYGVKRLKVVETRIRFKRFCDSEISEYLSSGEWQGRAGGYAIQGRAGAFPVKLSGSYSAVVGLPLRETVALLEGVGCRVSEKDLEDGAV